MIFLLRILFHGTGARRRQSISKLGLLPKLDSYVYGTYHIDVAIVFAAARAELEDDWGLLVTFVADGDWEIDPLFPHSLRSRQAVGPNNILSMRIVDPQDELGAHAWLKDMVAKITLEK